jgi:hypothetical protein
MHARVVAILLLGLGLLLAAPDRAAAACTADPLAADVRAARAEIAARCDCAGATSRRDFVRCAVGVARERRDAGLLDRAGFGAVRRCAKRSMCGRFGAVTCCIETPRRSRCTVKRRADRCRSVGDRIATVLGAESCCDAGAGSTTTTTSTTTSTVATTLPEIPCSGGDAYPTCDGTCPAGLACRRASVFDDFRLDCACLPASATACDDAAFPQCGGVCAGGRSCRPVTFIDADGGTTTQTCQCSEPAGVCAPAIGQCGGGLGCSNGGVCTLFSIGGSGLCNCVTTTTMPPTTTTVVTTSTTTTTLSGPLLEIPCDGGAGYPSCDGLCPPDHQCRRASVFDVLALECGCLPDGLTACDDAPFPTCGGVCAGGRLCRPVTLTGGTPGSTTSVCQCSEPAGECAPTFGQCGGGLGCPPGAVCTIFSAGAGAECGCAGP